MAAASTPAYSQSRWANVLAASGPLPIASLLAATGSDKYAVALVRAARRRSGDGGSQ